MLNEVESRVKSGKFSEQDEQTLRLDIHNKIPDLLMDNTDRNRTSPFAFTGNKFEVRAVGSSANCSSTMTVLNTIMADQLVKFKTEVDALIKKGENREVAILHVLKGYITSSKRILFEGNNYSVEWEKEAKKRGLNNIKTTPTALDAYSSKDTIAYLNAIRFLPKLKFMRVTKLNWKNILKRYKLNHACWAKWY